MEMFEDKPDAFVCPGCKKGHSSSQFNCSCGTMDCGHGWRTGGETRSTCDRCHVEAVDKVKAVELQNSGLRAALKKVDEILVPLLHEQDKRDRHQFLAEFSEVHDPRGIIRRALAGGVDTQICEQCKGNLHTGPCDTKCEHGLEICEKCIHPF